MLHEINHEPQLETRTASTVEDFLLLPGILSNKDLGALKTLCREHLATENSIPSYALIDELESDVFLKIKNTIEARVCESLYYLNDFYLYTDQSFQADWHVDTEMFTFDRSYNAWILLSPDEVESPLAVMRGKNTDEDNYFHSMKVDGGVCRFVNYANLKKETGSLESIEADKICAPDVKVGDILILNPKKFHKTNIKTPKHVLAIKFVVRGPNGFGSKMQVPGLFWPETKLFNELLAAAESWDNVTGLLRKKLMTESGRKVLSSGFFPEKLALYRKMVKMI